MRIFIDQSDRPDQLGFGRFCHTLRGALAGTPVAPRAAIQSGKRACDHDHANHAEANGHAQYKYRGGQRWRAQRQRFITRDGGFFFDALESVALSSALFGEGG